jgi:putative sugar O-methyltransferase
MSSPADIALDLHLYQRILDDMEQYAGIHRPADIWQMDRLFPDSKEKQQHPTFEDLVAPWTGTMARDRASKAQIAECRAFLDANASGGWTFDRLAPVLLGTSPTWADLRTMLDIGLVLNHFPHRKGTMRIVEVGGGYGRLAEGFLRTLADVLTYVVVDVVPASLCFAYQYLTQRFPDRSIGFFYLDEPKDVEAYDCYVVPTWHIDELSLGKFDVGVNIASMQEMTGEQVDYYLALFDRLVTRGGLFYFSNTRDFAYAHEYDYPAHWRLMLKTNTPLSVSVHYPIEIFERSDADWRRDNAVHEARYLTEVCAAYRTRLAETAAAHTASVEMLTERTTALQQANVSLKEKLARTRDRLNAKKTAYAELVKRLERVRSPD